MTDVGVRRLPEEDWRVFRDVRLAALRDSPGSFTSSCDHESAYDEMRWRELVGAGAVFVAEADGDPVGVAAGIARRPPGLGALWVAPPWRGTGVAAELVHAVLAWAHAGGHDRVTLWAPADDVRACRFYEKHGFAATGVRKPLHETALREVQEMARVTRPRGSAG